MSVTNRGNPCIRPDKVGPIATAKFGWQNDGKLHNRWTRELECCGSTRASRWIMSQPWMANSVWYFSGQNRQITREQFMDPEITQTDQIG